ncbi:MAG: hypothetical protein WAX07_07030 [Candidatus Altiarchaeia archaeon]
MKGRYFLLSFVVFLSQNAASTVCSALAPYSGTTTDTSSVIQACIDAEASGGTVELPAGKYFLDRQVKINAKPVTLKTREKTTDTPRCTYGQLNDCAELIASRSLADCGGLLDVAYAGSVIDHIIINGNKDGRRGASAESYCKASNTCPGYNMRLRCSGCTFTNSVSENALCGTGMEVSGRNDNVHVTNSLFAFNGIHDSSMLWADGLTVHDCSNSVFTGNYFVDGTDIDFIFGGCQNCIIQNNSIRHTNQFRGAAFASLMIHAWSSTSGNYTGTVLSNNAIDCEEKKRCGFGLYLGADAWYTTNSYGGSFHDNTVTNAQQGVVLDDVHHMEVYNNPVSGVSGYRYTIGTRSNNIDTSKDTLGTTYTARNWDGSIPNMNCPNDCSVSANHAKYVSQTVPTTMVAGRTYTVSVTMRNRGTTTWTRTGNYNLGSQNPQDTTLWGANRAYLDAGDYIEPIDTDTKTFSFTVTAPTTPGTYNFQRSMVQDGVEWFGESTQNVVVQVVTALPNDAQYISQSVPSTMVKGQTYSASITLKNTGTNTWTAANQYVLGSQNPQDNGIWGTGRVGLASGDSIASGSSKTFSFNVVAPASPGTYDFQWRMLREGVEWFGEYTQNARVSVVTTTTSATTRTTTTSTTTTTRTTTTTSTTRTTTTTSTTRVTTTTATTRTTTTTTRSSTTSTTMTTSTTTTTSSTSTSWTSTTSPTSSSSTTTSTSATSSTTLQVCLMPGNYSPCGEVTLGEIIDAITKWVNGLIPLGNIIDLINSWADPAANVPI